MSTAWFPENVSQNAIFAPDPVVVDRASVEPCARFAPEHVVSRTIDGEVKSRFKDDKWNFASQTAGNKATISFTKIKNQELKSDVKELSLYLWHLGGKAFSTFRADVQQLLMISQLCERDGLSLQAALASPTAIDDYLVELEKHEDLSPVRLFSLLLNTVMLCRHRAGQGFRFQVNPELQARVDERRAELAKTHEAIQTPVIPKRIYSAFTELALNEVERLLTVVDSIEAIYNVRSDFLTEFLARNHPGKRWEELTEGQKTSARSVVSSNMQTQKYSNHWIRLSEVSGYEIENLHQLNSMVNTAQVLCAGLIAQFTGMRVGEVRNTPLNGWEAKTIKGQPVCGINSYTSKLNGGVYKPEFWVTSGKLEPAFELAQHLAKLNYQYVQKIALPPKSSDWNRYPLFPLADFSEGVKNPIFNMKNVADSYLSRKLKEWAAHPNRNGVFSIKKDDMRAVLALDPDADWEDRKKIAVGLVWPLAFHQFRRSLIVYASKAGVSLNVLKGVAKHVNEAMTEYYGRGSIYVEGLDLKRSKTPEGLAQFVVEFAEEQIETEAAQIHTVLQDVASEAQTFFGGAGGRIQKGVDSGEIDIRFQTIEATKEAVKRGDLAWRETELGACTFTGKCHRTLNLSVPCASCGDAVLRDDPDVIAVLECAAEDMEATSQKPDQSPPRQAMLAKEAKKIRTMLSTAPSQQEAR